MLNEMHRGKDAKTQSERYMRNILLPKVDKKGQEKLFNSKILVCGAGGLGSTVLANLASVGIGVIGIVDKDIVEISNLNRQYIHNLKNIGIEKTKSAQNWVKKFNPEIEVKTYQLNLDENNYPEIVKNYDLIIDCFDSYESKFLLNKIAVKTDKTLIHGGVTEFFGQVSVIIPQKTACLECILPEQNEEISKGIISPAVSTIASIQAMETVKIILNIGEILENKLLTYDGLKAQFKTINLSKNPNCKLCSNL